MDMPQAFAGRDIVWYRDNEPACASFIRASKQEDVSEVAALVLLSLMKLNARIWLNGLIPSVPQPTG